MGIGRPDPGLGFVAQLDVWLDGIFDAENVEGLIGPASD